MSRWVAMHCGEEMDKLQTKHPGAFLLLCQIARRARWQDSAVLNLRAGEAFIGDWKAAGLHSQNAYRHAKKVLQDTGLVTFRTTNRGTIATLVNAGLFSISTAAGHGRGNEPGHEPAHGQSDSPATTNHTDTHPQRHKDTGGPSIEDIYQEYPRKVSRKDAIKAIRHAARTHDRAYLMKQTKLYAAAIAGMDLRYVPNPATWFNGERYADDPSSWNPHGGKVPATPAATADGFVPLFPGHRPH